MKLVFRILLIILALFALMFIANVILKSKNIHLEKRQPKKIKVYDPSKKTASVTGLNYLELNKDDYFYKKVLTND